MIRSLTTPEQILEFCKGFREAFKAKAQNLYFCEKKLKQVLVERNRVFVVALHKKFKGFKFINAGRFTHPKLDEEHFFLKIGDTFFDLFTEGTLISFTKEHGFYGQNIVPWRSDVLKPDQTHFVIFNWLIEDYFGMEELSEADVFSLLISKRPFFRSLDLMEQKQRVPYSMVTQTYLSVIRTLKALEDRIKEHQEQVNPVTDVSQYFTASAHQAWLHKRQDELRPHLPRGFFNLIPFKKVLGRCGVDIQVVEKDQTKWKRVAVLVPFGKIYL